MTQIATGDTSIFARTSGEGRPLLLLHGFPETHLMWRDVAPLLAQRFTVVCADLTGYGHSGCPAADARHERYSKRAIARDMVAVMNRLGFDRFFVAGHDRGGRVAYRLSLDHPACVMRLAVLDIVPTEAAWRRADDRFALGFWPWSLLAQVPPLPERILGMAADAIVDHAFATWGSAPSAVPAAVRDEYAAALRDGDHPHAICEEYRAAATIDRVHDRADRSAGRTLACPLLVLWSARGPLATWYEPDGPLGMWRSWAADVRGRPMPGGHFFPEELPRDTAAALAEFFGESSTTTYG